MEEWRQVSLQLRQEAGESTSTGGWGVRRKLRTIGVNGVTLPSAARLAIATSLAVMLATALVLVAASPPVMADDSGVFVSTGQGVFPMASSNIRMDSETVQAICYRNFAEYRVDFKFVNDGPPQTLQLGFASADVMPANAVDDESAVADAQHGAPVALRAWQDGKPLQVTFGKGKDPLLSASWVGYYLHTASFPHGETMITVSYLAGAVKDGYSYWLHTGAYWNGPIGKAIVRYRPADSFEDGGVLAAPTPDKGGAYPDSYVKVDDRTYQWVFDSLEPTADDDIALVFPAPRLSEDFKYGGGVALPASFGAVAEAQGVSERLGPNTESSDPPGWEAVDGNPATAWGFSAKAREVQGQWLRIGVRGDQDLREIRILPGRNDSPTSFKEYARPKTVAVNWGLGEQEITLRDEPSLQKFEISHTIDNLTLYIVDFYPGTKSNDVYISEIDLGNAPAPQFDTYANMMAGGTPPTTQAVPAYETSTMSGLSTTSGTVTTTSVSGTTLATTSTPPTAATGDPANRGGATEGGSPRLLWAVIVVGVLAAAAVGVSIYLGARLRSRGRASGDA